MVLDSLAKSYRWSHQEMMQLTLPQIVMYNHASTVNWENAERKSKAKGGNSYERPEVEDNFEGKPIDSLSTDQMSRYLEF